MLTNESLDNYPTATLDLPWLHPKPRLVSKARARQSKYHIRKFIGGFPGSPLRRSARKHLLAWDLLSLYSDGELPWNFDYRRLIHHYPRKFRQSYVCLYPAEDNRPRPSSFAGGNPQLLEIVRKTTELTTRTAEKIFLYPHPQENSSNSSGEDNSFYKTIYTISAFSFAGLELIGRIAAGITSGVIFNPCLARKLLRQIADLFWSMRISLTGQQPKDAWIDVKVTFGDYLLLHGAVWSLWLITHNCRGTNVAHNPQEFWQALTVPPRMKDRKDRRDRIARQLALLLRHCILHNPLSVLLMFPVIADHNLLPAAPESHKALRTAIDCLFSLDAAKEIYYMLADYLAAAMLSDYANVDQTFFGEFDRESRSARFARRLTTMERMFTEAGDSNAFRQFAARFYQHVVAEWTEVPPSDNVRWDLLPPFTQPLPAENINLLGFQVANSAEDINKVIAQLLHGADFVEVGRTSAIDDAGRFFMCRLGKLSRRDLPPPLAARCFFGAHLADVYWFIYKDRAYFYNVIDREDPPRPVFFDKLMQGNQETDGNVLWDACQSFFQPLNALFAAATAGSAADDLPAMLRRIETNGRFYLEWLNIDPPSVSYIKNEVSNDPASANN